MLARCFFLYSERARVEDEEERGKESHARTAAVAPITITLAPPPVLLIDIRE